MKHFEMERIKIALGLPPTAGVSQIEAKISEFRDKAAHLDALKGAGLPPEERPEIPAEEEVTLVSELRKMQYEPMLPVEKKLISWSIVLGVICLVLFVWISYTFFPGTH